MTLYESVIAAIKGKIASGAYTPGDRVESLSEIQSLYGVSKITATRAMEELCRQGIVTKVQGKGTYVNAVAPSPDAGARAKKSRIARFRFLIDERVLFIPNHFEARIYQGAVERAKELEFPFRVDAPSPELEHYQGVFPKLDLAPDEGIVFYPGCRRKILSRLLETAPSLVLVDSVGYGAQCVVTDNRDGMDRLVARLAEWGHRRVAFAPLFAVEAAFFNANERAEACARAAAGHGMAFRLFETRDYADIVRSPREDQDGRPTAILFPNDDSALNGVRAFEEAGYRVPEDVSVCGFDDYSPTGKDLSRLTTVRVFPEALGRAAVDAARAATAAEPEDAPPLWRRVKPEPVFRETAGRPYP